MRRLLEVLGLVLVSVVIILFADRVLPDDFLDPLVARISPDLVATVAPTATATPPSAAATDTPAPTDTPQAMATDTPAPTVPPTDTPTVTSVPTETPTPTITPGAVVSSDGINVRSGPGTDFAPVGTAALNQNFDVRGRNEAGDWYYVCCLADGAAGWVFAELVQLNTSPDTLRVALPDGTFPTDTPTPTPPAAETPAETATVAAETPAMTETPVAADTPAATDTPAVGETPTAQDTPSPDASASTLTGYPCVGVALMRGTDVACAVTNFIVVNFTQSANVLDYDWSPDGTTMALVVEREGRQFILLARTDGAQVDTLGEGVNPAWSPDSQTLAFRRGDQMWSRRLADGIETQLTQQAGWQWGQAVFTPDSQSVLVAGAAADAFDANGNAAFFFYTVPVAGGELAQLPGMAEPEQGALPVQVQFSFDGSRFAYETAAREDACLVRGDYVTRSADGSDRRSLVPQAVTDMVAQGERRFVSGGSFAWLTVDMQVVLTAAVQECADATSSPTTVGNRTVYLVDGATGAVAATWESEARDFSWYRLGGRIVYTVPAGPGQETDEVYRSSPDGSDASSFGVGSRPAYKPV